MVQLVEQSLLSPESSHPQFYLLPIIYIIGKLYLKVKIKKKRPAMAQFFKKSVAKARRYPKVQTVINETVACLILTKF